MSGYAVPLFIMWIICAAFVFGIGAVAVDGEEGLAAAFLFALLYVAVVIGGIAFGAVVSWS